MEVDVMPFVVVIIIILLFVVVVVLIYLLSMLRCCHCFITIMDGVLPFSENGTRLPSSAKKHPIWHFCRSRELIFAELGKKAPFSEKGAVITGALRVTTIP
jgi:hypothetical protein